MNSLAAEGGLTEEDPFQALLWGSIVTCYTPGRHEKKNQSDNSKYTRFQNIWTDSMDHAAFFYH